MDSNPVTSFGLITYKWMRAEFFFWRRGRKNIFKSRFSLICHEKISWNLSVVGHGKKILNLFSWTWGKNCKFRQFVTRRNCEMYQTVMVKFAKFVNSSPKKIRTFIFLWQEKSNEFRRLVTKYLYLEIGQLVRKMWNSPVSCEEVKRILSICSRKKP